MQTTRGTRAAVALGAALAIAALGVGIASAQDAEPQYAGLDPRHVEELLDQPGEPLSLPDDTGEGLAEEVRGDGPLAIQAAEHQLGVPAQGRHRCLVLVGRD